MLITSPAISPAKYFIRENQDIIGAVSTIAHNLKLYVSNHIIEIGYILTLELRCKVAQAIKELESLRPGASQYIEKIVNRVNGCFALPNKRAVDHLVEAQRAKVAQQLQDEFRKNLLDWQEYRDSYCAKLRAAEEDDIEDIFARKIAGSTDQTADYLIHFYEQRISEGHLMADILPAWFDFVIQRHPGVENILPGITKQLRTVRELAGMRNTTRYKEGWLPGVTRAAEPIINDKVYRSEVLGFRRNQEFPDGYVFKDL